MIGWLLIVTGCGLLVVGGFRYVTLRSAAEYVITGLVFFGVGFLQL